MRIYKSKAPIETESNQKLQPFENEHSKKGEDEKVISTND
ncbi:hypothetical protein BACPU_30630 [Bacillus pumilus]|nr:hypothetical protein BACPU_30630 [Bacillus pumilus]